ncbi:hypothetical protein [Streptomyces sp. NPDC101165]|uniref:hypothetical protein n=1 Tax=Streptomyces sp. NPDC101165 TaxID=3366119 RepID=UPI0037FD3BEE
MLIPSPLIEECFACDPGPQRPAGPVPSPLTGRTRRVEDAHEEVEPVGQLPPLPRSLVDAEVVEGVFTHLCPLPGLLGEPAVTGRFGPASGAARAHTSLRQVGPAVPAQIPSASGVLVIAMDPGGPTVGR